VRKSLLKLLWAIAGLALSASVHAVGMGGINVTSALGQPLKADIELMTVSRTERDSLVAHLASPDAYKTAALEYPYGIKFKFEILSRQNGEQYIKVSSTQSINDPFVSLLVELSWSAGKLSREYTFLLDPVGYVPAQPAPAEVQAVAPAIATAPPAIAPAASAVPPVEQAAPVAAVVPVEQTTPMRQPPVETAASAVPEVSTEATARPEEEAVPVPVEIAAEPAEETATPADMKIGKEWIAVQRGDTMYKIAERYKLADMNLERMLVALYRANVNQFGGKNMNRIRAGKILHLPTEEEYANVTLPEAVKEIHAQAVDWNAYRQKLASAAAASHETQAAQQVATGKVTSSVADKTPVAKETAKEVLKLSRGEAPGDQTAASAGSKQMTAQDKKNAAQENAIAQAKSLKEGQARAALLEKNLQDMKRLAQLKSEAAALAQPPSAAPAAAPVPAAVPAPAKPAEASPAKPKPKVVAEPSLIDQVMDEPLYQAGVVAALLVLGGLGYMVFRRKKKRYDEEVGEEAEDIGSTTGRMAAPVIPSPDTGDFTRTTITQSENLQSDAVDPISEADLFLNFGRDVQAEEILKDALKNTPNNHQIHLKLLGIYANRKDTNSFSNIARQLKDSGDEEAWQQAVEMGRKLEPDNPMYGGFKSMEDTGSATVQMTAFNALPGMENAPVKPSPLDFDFDAGATSAKGLSSIDQDFLGGEKQTMVTPAQDAGMDFDITSTNPAMPAADDTGGMVFDVTDSHPAMPEETPADMMKADDGGMAFTLDFPVEKTAAKTAPAESSSGIGLGGINLNFDDALSAPSTASAGGDDHWQEVATKLDLAKAYMEMGDNDGAREILEEVTREGDDAQRETAQALFEKLL